MKKFDLLIQQDVTQFAELVCELTKDHNTPKLLEEHLSLEVTQEELMRINSIALRYNQPLFSSGKQ
ncbi:hypothetical protein ACTQ6A_02910 [Lachnospiraceae bacterium LCP25S3_G4]